MKLAKNTDWILTIIYCVLGILLIGAVFYLFHIGDSVINGTMDMGSKQYDSNDVAAGYEAVLSGLGILGGIMGSLVLYVTGFFFGFLAVVLELTSLVAFLRQKKYKENGDEKHIRRNLITKAILNGIVTAFLVWLLFEEITLGGVFACLLIAGLEVFLLYLLKLLRPE